MKYLNASYAPSFSFRHQLNSTKAIVAKAQQLAHFRSQKGQLVNNRFKKLDEGMPHRRLRFDGPNARALFTPIKLNRKRRFEHHSNLASSTHISVIPILVDEIRQFFHLEDQLVFRHRPWQQCYRYYEVYTRQDAPSLLPSACQTSQLSIDLWHSGTKNIFTKSDNSL